MKALIFSDSHGDFMTMYNIIKNTPNVDLIIHAGDVQRDVEDLLDAFPRIPCAYVLGNNDFFAFGVPFDRVFTFGGKKVFLTHGHKYSVKLSPARVVAEAKKKSADICIFGHTHSKYLDMGEIAVVNPGSARYGYAILTVENEEIKIEQK